MFGLFNTENRFTATLQACQLVSCFYSVWSYCTDPDSTWDEQGIRAVLSLLNVVTLSGRLSSNTAFATLIADVMEVGATLRGVTSGWSNEPLSINVLMMVLDALSAIGNAESASAAKRMK